MPSGRGGGRGRKSAKSQAAAAPRKPQKHEDAARPGSDGNDSDFVDGPKSNSKGGRAAPKKQYSAPKNRNASLKKAKAGKDNEYGRVQQKDGDQGAMDQDPEPDSPTVMKTGVSFGPAVIVAPETPKAKEADIWDFDEADVQAAPVPPTTGKRVKLKGVPKQPVFPTSPSLGPPPSMVPPKTAKKPAPTQTAPAAEAVRPASPMDIQYIVNENEQSPGPSHKDILSEFNKPLEFPDVPSRTRNRKTAPAKDKRRTTEVMQRAPEEEYEEEIPKPRIVQAAPRVDRDRRKTVIIQNYKEADTQEDDDIMFVGESGPPKGKPKLSTKENQPRSGKKEAQQTRAVAEKTPVDAPRNKRQARSDKGKGPAKDSGAAANVVEVERKRKRTSGPEDDDPTPSKRARGRKDTASPRPQEIASHPLDAFFSQLGQFVKGSRRSASFHHLGQILTQMEDQTNREQALAYAGTVVDSYSREDLEGVLDAVQVYRALEEVAANKKPTKKVEPSKATCLFFRKFVAPKDWKPFWSYYLDHHSNKEPSPQKLEEVLIDFMEQQGKTVDIDMDSDEEPRRKEEQSKQTKAKELQEQDELEEDVEEEELVLADGTPPVHIEAPVPATFAPLSPSQPKNERPSSAKIRSPASQSPVPSPPRITIPQQQPSSARLPPPVPARNSRSTRSSGSPDSERSFHSLKETPSPVASPVASPTAVAPPQGRKPGKTPELAPTQNEQTAFSPDKPYRRAKRPPGDPSQQSQPSQGSQAPVATYYGPAEPQYGARQPKSGVRPYETKTTATKLERNPELDAKFGSSSDNLSSSSPERLKLPAAPKLQPRARTKPESVPDSQELSLSRRTSGVSQDRSEEGKLQLPSYEPSPGDVAPPNVSRFSLPTAGDEMVEDSQAPASNEPEKSDSQAIRDLGAIEEALSSAHANISSDNRLSGSSQAGSYSQEPPPSYLDRQYTPSHDQRGPHGTPLLASKRQNREEEDSMVDNYRGLQELSGTRNSSSGRPPVKLDTDEDAVEEDIADEEVEGTPMNAVDREEMLTVARQPLKGPLQFVVPKTPKTPFTESQRKLEPKSRSPGRLASQLSQSTPIPGNIKGKGITALRRALIATHEKQGYRTASRHDPKPIKIHDTMEDAKYIREEVLHKPSGLRYRLMILADGHGGPDCAKFVIQELPGRIQKAMDRLTFDGLTQNSLERAFVSSIRSVDEDYLKILRARFEAWTASGGEESTRPADDGSTLIVNAIFPDFVNPGSGDEFFLNVNLGDSRTCLLESPHKGRFRFDVLYFSDDHHPGHPDKAHHIVHKTGASATIKLADPRSQNLNVPRQLHEIVGTPTEGPRNKHIEALRQGRVIRTDEYLFPESEAVKLGLKVGQHINCGDAMGDLLFKLAPAAFECRPDANWILLRKDHQYIICAATDGMWDAMKTQTRQPRKQCEELAFLIQKGFQDDVNRLFFFGDSAPSNVPSLSEAVMQARLEKFASGLAELQKNEFKVFNDHTVYDDTTVVLMAIDFE